MIPIVSFAKHISAFCDGDKIYLRLSARFCPDLSKKDRATLTLEPCKKHMHFKTQEQKFRKWCVKKYCWYDQACQYSALQIILPDYLEKPIVSNKKYIQTNLPFCASAMCFPKVTQNISCVMFKDVFLYICWRNNSMSRYIIHYYSHFFVYYVLVSYYLTDLILR